LEIGKLGTRRIDRPGAGDARWWHWRFWRGGSGCWSRWNFRRRRRRRHWRFRPRTIDVGYWGSARVVRSNSRRVDEHRTQLSATIQYRYYWRVTFSAEQWHRKLQLFPGICDRYATAVGLQQFACYQ